MHQVVSRLLADGVPIDGVGHQLHLNLVRPVSWVDDSITRFRELGLTQAVTELDVSIVASAGESLPAPPPERLIRQGYYYRELFEVLRSHSDVLESVTAWGLYDARSWLRSNAPHEAPLFFDDDLQSKPAYVGVVDPAQLPHLPQSRTVPAATPEVDGERDLAWQQLPDVVLRAGEDGAATAFQVRWDDGHLYVLAEVADQTTDPADRVDIYVGDSNAKAGEYQDDDAHYTVGRDGSHSGGATAAEVVATDDGYRVEAALPLATAGSVGRDVGFDIRVTDGAEQVSWSDQDHGQDTDTSRWGTVSLVAALGHADIPRATAAPTVDGVIDAAWGAAATVVTEVRVEGDPAGAKGRVRLLWDAEHLYVLAEVDDPQLDADNSNPWEHDSVELFVDPGNTKSGAFQPADGQYRVNFENHQTVNGDLAVIGDNLTSAAAVVDGGYLVEASIALTGMDPAAGAFIGLEFQVNDATDGARTAVHTWHDPTGQSFQDTTRWGVARLVDADPVEPVCDRTVSGVHLGSLTVTGGTTCVEDATVLGLVKVGVGASLVAHDANLLGGVLAADPALVTLADVRVLGTVRVSGATERLELTGNRVLGAVTLTGNQTGDNPLLVSGNTVIGVLSCTGNQPAPVDGGVPNTVVGVALGQCRTL
jgi:endo-1,4-beta-xylanase